MLFLEARGGMIIRLSGIKNDLKNIVDYNIKYGRQQGWKGWAKDQNNHLRQALKNCVNRINERPIAFMRDNESPVYAFHIQNPSRSKNYYFICILNGNVLEGRALLCGSSLVPDFILTKKKSDYLNAKPNPNYQMFIDNPNLIEYTLNGKTDSDSNDNSNNDSSNDSTYDSKIYLITQFTKKCCENHKRVSLSMRKYLYRSGYVITENRIIKRGFVD